MGLKIYKASAGSGKTYTLAVEYIKFLIQNPRAYKQILAVTFTNKATTEMKERIVQQLYGLATGDAASDSYLHSISTGLKGRYTEAQIREQAGKALHYILHDYSRFRVQTIDAFYQEVMRNLARELNLMPNMSIELDNRQVVDKAVEHLISRLQRGNQVLGWLEDFIEERIVEGKRWNVEDDTKEFGLHLFDETYQQLGSELNASLTKNPQLISDYKTKLRKLADMTNAYMKRVGEKFYRLLEENNLTMDDLAYKSKGICSYFNKLIRGDYLITDTICNATAIKHLESAEAWSPKGSKRRKEIISIAENTLQPFLKNIEEMRKDSAQLVNTCQLSLKHLNKLQLLDSISQQVTLDNREANRFMLSGTNALLHHLMDDGDANFIFEKIGTSIKHVMIDEFQDTSSMQWDNFKLLLDNILAEGRDCLIVGDVKQSIYRWRNGDWNILNRLGTDQGEFKRHITVEPLNYNRRSEAGIIRFNNALFQKALPYFRTLLPKEPDEEYTHLEQAYADVVQQIPEGRDSGKGHVKIKFADAQEDYVKTTIEQLGEEVQRLKESGISYRQMAILLRSKTRLPEIAAYFETVLGIPLVSDEAFLLNASEAVCLLVDALRCLSAPDDPIARTSLRLGYELLHRGEQHASWHDIFRKDNAEVSLPSVFEERSDELRQLPLYELVEELYTLFGLDEVKDQDAYLLSFMDAVTLYLRDNPSDIDAFLHYWDEQLSQKAIAGGEAEGIRVLTIHSAKGLQFHTVLLPFCDWTLEKDSMHEQLLWEKSIDTQPFNELDIVPMSYGRQMRESLYQSAYEKERLQLWVDNLNLLYVALTRAEKNLFLWSKRTGFDAKLQKKEPATINSLLECILPDVAQQVGTWDEEAGTYAYGELYTTTAADKQAEGNKLTQRPDPRSVQMVSERPRLTFRQSNRSADFIAGIDETESPQRFINRGKLLHEVFSAIHTKDEVDDAIRQLVFEGVIGSSEEQHDIQALVQKALELPQVQDWYSGSWKLYNECDIIWMEHDELQQRRPDRVMQRGNEWVVIDFKFGQPQDKYHRQVQGYMNLLRGMEGNADKDIRGYLWYVDAAQIVPVES